jgi:Xaa-Pro aminopeptidase
VHEEPRIIPRTDRVLEAGMVIAVEPGTYGEGWGVRVEQLLLVTAEGCEVLSQHDLSL